MSASPIVSGIQTGMGLLGAANNVFGPQGALVTGDISKGAQAMGTLGSTSQSIVDWLNKSDVPKTPTIMSTMGLSPQQFKQIEPESGAKLLRQAMAGFRGEDVGAFGISPEEFNRIPPEVRQELLRRLAGR